MENTPLWISDFLSLWLGVSSTAASEKVLSRAWAIIVKSNVSDFRFSLPLFHKCSLNLILSFNFVPLYLLSKDVEEQRRK